MGKREGSQIPAVDDTQEQAGPLIQAESVPRRKPRFRERNAIRPERPERQPQPLEATARVVRRAPRQLPQTRVAINRERALYAALFALGFGVRIWDVGSRAMHGDEAVHAWLSWNLYTGAGYQYDPVYHGPLQFLVTSAFFFLFGDSDTTARLMAVLFGSALVVLPYFLRHWMGRAASLLASAFIAVSPAFVYVSRLERDDIFTATFALIMAIALFQFVRTLRARYFYLGAASITLSLSAMENTYITLFVFGTFTLLVLLSEHLAARPASPLARLWTRTGTANRVTGSFPAFVAAALVVAFGITVLFGLHLPVPFVAAVTLVLLVNRQTTLRVLERGETPFLDAFRSLTRAEWITALTLMAAILFLTFSTFGTNPRGIWDSSQPLFNTGNACPGNSYFLNACRKDIIGGLFYWLSQHQVHRGGQPWFYYTLLFGLYEQIAMIFGAAGIVWTILRPTFFRTFLAYWAVAAFGIYSWAGEKFPWLLIHPLLPFTLLAAMFVVHALRQPSAVRYAVAGALALLGLLQLHTTYVLNFLNGADPVEMMVYVQSAPDTPKVANDILTTSYKATGGNDLHVSIDSLDTWPFAWYLRHMPNVGYPSYPQLLQKPFSTDPVIIVDESHQPALAPLLGNRYVGRRYRLRWWFPEDYKALTWKSFARDAVNPGYWSVIAQWLVERRPFGPRQAVWFYYYVQKGLTSPY